ncbi:MAG: ABC transporter permease [Chitinophagaceae bacterium]|nr:ABC transporter permease [Bacteroidota bacterium]MCC6258799.1 ABC transporter permease [Chitinophagaceae bacterium]MCW5917840.1 ABC transporter permease [Ferruginibacter sp.]
MKTNSTRATTWQRFRRNPSAMFGAIILFLFILIAILGYSITPDKTRNADQQSVEIQAMPPGYSQMFLAIQNNNRPQPWYWPVTGKLLSKRLIPINSYSVRNDSLYFQQYVDADTSFAASIPYKANGNITILQKKYLLGTDGFGRDMLSRLMIGARVSLSVGLIAVFISLFIGVFLGAISGYYRGRIDAVVMWLINVTWSIPTLLLVFALTLALGKGFWQIFIAVGLTMWVNVARLVRGQVLAMSELEFIQASKVLGVSNMRIIFRHILPNILGPILVIATANFAAAIIIEAGLSFLGIGVQPPVPSWGLMIKENYNFIITQHPMLALLPGIAIMLLVLSVNLVGNGLRDAMDVRSGK